MIHAEKQTTEVVTSTFVIQLFNGKIEGRSKINLQKLVDSLGSNLKKAIVEPVLKEIGLNVSVNGDNTTIVVENQELLADYFQWRVDKAANTKPLIKNYGVAEVL
jgi:hypothetical protein